MKITKKLLPLFAITIFFGCSNIKVTSDSDKATDFTQYKSFSFLGWQEDSDKILNEFDKKRLRDAFNEEFSKRNLNLVEKNGDMAVSLFIVINQETTVTAYTNYYGGYGGRYRGYGYGWGGGYASTSYSQNDYLKGTLVMDVFDEKSGEQIWQGVLRGTVEETPEKRDKAIPRTVSALMKKFPIGPVK